MQIDRNLHFLSCPASSANITAVARACWRVRRVGECSRSSNGVRARPGELGVQVSAIVIASGLRPDERFGAAVQDRPAGALRFARAAAFLHQLARSSSSASPEHFGPCPHATHVAFTCHPVAAACGAHPRACVSFADQSSFIRIELSRSSAIRSTRPMRGAATRAAFSSRAAVLSTAPTPLSEPQTCDRP